jgi:FYVE zinc finger
METLFGNVPPGARGAPAPANVDLDTMSGSVLPRTLLPSSVIFSETTKSWVATINTNQKALEANNVEESSKSLRAFSVPTQKQAVALARAWAPPQMHPFASNPTCLICEAQFAVFRRACHCRNCGVCICGPCSLQWPVKMLPVTYNIKKESTVTICRACDWLCTEFRLALLRGDHDKVVALYSTGNINLTTPFANVKGELL